MDMTLDVKPNAANWVIIGLMAVTFIVFFKFAVNHFQNPVTNFVAPVVNSV